MSESSSHLLFEIEYGLIGMPFVLIMAVATLGIVISVASSPDSALYLLVVVAGWVALGAGWKLSRAFLDGGVTALRQVNRVWWVIASCATLIPVANGAGLLVLHFGGIPFTPAPLSVANPFGLGPSSFAAAALPWLAISPLLIPLIHLYLEYRFRYALSSRSSGP